MGDFNTLRSEKVGVGRSVWRSLLIGLNHGRSANLHYGRAYMGKQFSIKPTLFVLTNAILMYT